MLVKRDCKFDQDVAHYETVATQIEYPDVAAPSDDCLVCGPERETGRARGSTRTKTGVFHIR